MVTREAVAVAVLCAALLAAAPAGASHQQGGGGPRDFAVGSARNTFFPQGTPSSLQVSAHGSGADAKGHARGSGIFVEALGPFTVSGEVTCLRVEGNRATIKYRFKKTEGNVPQGGAQVFVEDNGPPGGGVPDANSTDLPMEPELFEPLAGVCEDPNTRPYNPVDSGNYVVHDAG